MDEITIPDFRPEYNHEDEGRPNADRATSAEHGLAAYCQEKGEEFDADTAMDLVTDLMHFAHQQGENPFRLLNRAKMNFEPESGCEWTGEQIEEGAL